MDTLSFIMALEGGDEELTIEQYVDGMAELVRTGAAWSLQGSYGRAAALLIESGYVSPDGEVIEYPEAE